MAIENKYGKSAVDATRRNVLPLYIDAMAGQISGDFLPISGGTLTGNLTIAKSSGESDLIVNGPAGSIYLYSASSSSGNRGLWAAAHGTATSGKAILRVDTNNNTYYSSGTVEGALTTNGNITVNRRGSTLVKNTIYPIFTVLYNNEAGTTNYQAVPLAIIGTDGTDGYNSAVLLGSQNGTTWVGAGEGSRTLPTVLSVYNDETLRFVADGQIYFYSNCANDGSSYNNALRLNGGVAYVNEQKVWTAGNMTYSLSGTTLTITTS